MSIHKNNIICIPTNNVYSYKILKQNLCLSVSNCCKKTDDHNIEEVDIETCNDLENEATEPLIHKESEDHEINFKNINPKMVSEQEDGIVN